MLSEIGYDLSGFYETLKMLSLDLLNTESSLSRNHGTKGLRTVSNTVLCSNYFCSGTLHTVLFGHKNRSRVNAKIGLIGNGKLPFKVLLIVFYPLFT
jgi:hypothetical protein